jgi:glutamine phosphoribosylpyrophosphate amidotransferase
MDRREDSQQCLYEYSYLARTEGTINGVHVQTARHNMGKRLASVMPVDADIVIGMPDTGLDVAEGYAAGSGIPFEPRAVIKNQYVGRTFIDRDGRRGRAVAGHLTDCVRRHTLPFAPSPQAVRPRPIMNA